MACRTSFAARLLLALLCVVAANSRVATAAAIGGSAARRLLGLRTGSSAAPDSAASAITKSQWDFDKDDGTVAPPKSTLGDIWAAYEFGRRRLLGPRTGSAAAPDSAASAITKSQWDFDKDGTVAPPSVSSDPWAAYEFGRRRALLSLASSSSVAGRYPFIDDGSE